MTSEGPSALDPSGPTMPGRGGLWSAVAFLTPFGGPARPTPGALPWFPVVGAAVGLVLGGVWWAASQVWPAPVAAALVVVADLAVTGMLHFDGLLDSADGMLAQLPRERRLAVMAHPEVGAYAVAVGVVVLLGRWVSIASLPAAPLLMAGLWCGSRTLMAAVVGIVAYARDGGGLATTFLGPTGVPAFVVAVVGAIGAVALAAAWNTVAGPAAVVAGLAAGVAVVALARHQIGGFTGDVLGAAGVAAETVGLIVAAAKW